MRIFSFKPEYKVSWDKEPLGKLSGSLTIDSLEPDAWTVFQPWEGDTVVSGYHHVPLFKGAPSDIVWSDIRESGCNPDTLKVSHIQC